MAADGIKITIRADVRQAEKAMKALEEQGKRLEKSEKKVGHMSENHKQMGADAQKAYAEAEKALRKYEAATEKANSRKAFLEKRAIANADEATRRSAEKAYADIDKAQQKYEAAASKAASRKDFIEQRTLTNNPNATRSDMNKALKKDSVYHNAAAAADAAMAQHEKLAAALDNLVKKNADVNKALSTDSTYHNAESAAESAKAEYDKLAAASDKLAAKHGALTEKLEQAKTALASERQGFADLQRSVNDAAATSTKAKDLFKEAMNSFALGAKQGAAVVKSAMAAIRGKVTEVARKAAGAFKTGVAAMGKGARSLASGLKNAVSRLFQFRKASQQTSGAAGGLSKAVLKMGTLLKAALLRKSITAMVNGAKEGLQNLARYSTQTNADLSALKSSMTQLKNSFATAFAPILTAITPALTAMADALSKVTTQVGQLFAALSGQKSFTKATAVTEDYAASLGDAGKAAEDAKKTLGFDTLNQVSGSSGNNAGARNAGVGEMFEEVEIPSWADRIRDMFLSQDWEGLGTYAAGGVNNGLAKLADMISWDTVGASITGFIGGVQGTVNSMVAGIDWTLAGAVLGVGVNTLLNTFLLLLTGFDWYGIGAALAASLNGAIAGIDWATLGAVLGAYFNVLLDTLTGFVQTFDWAAAGAALGTALQGLFDTVDWVMLGQLLADSFNGVVALLLSFITTFDWAGNAAKLMDGLNTFIAGVDWAAVGALIGEFFNGALNFLLTAIAEFDFGALVVAAFDMLVGFITSVQWGELGQKVSDAITNVFKSTAKGIQEVDWDDLASKAFDAIWDFVSNIKWAEIASAIFEFLGSAIGAAFRFIVTIGTKIAEKVKDAIDKAQEYFKQKIEDAGGNIIEGIYTGIKDALTGIGQWIKTNIFEPFINGFKKAFGIHSPSTEMATMGNFMVDGLKNGLIGIWESVSGIFTGVMDNIKGIFSADKLKEIGDNIVKGIGNGISAAKNWLNDKVGGVIGGIVDGAKNLLGIHSPSRVFAEIGGYTIEGMTQGIHKQTAEAERTVLSDISRITGAMSDRLLERAQMAAKVPAYSTGKLLPASQHAAMQTHAGAADIAAAVKQAVSEVKSNDRALHIDLYIEGGARFGRAILPSIEAAAAGRGVSLTVKGV